METTTKLTPASAKDIAEYFIWKAAQKKRIITNKKLQKLVYYAQAWYLVSSQGKEKLFPEKIEAWVHGPVVPSLYYKYKKFGFDPIDPQLGNENGVSAEIKELLDEVWNEYGELDADTLEALTHGELPWRDARKSLDRDEFSSTEIDTSLMAFYYSSRKKNGKQIQA